jgi:hypothetical protein
VSADGPTYQATYRRTEVALPSLVGVLAAPVILPAVFRLHHWTIEAGGVRISERPNRTSPPTSTALQQRCTRRPLVLAAR